MKKSSTTSSMADQPLAQTSKDRQVARLLISKIEETVDNFKLHALPLLSLYEQWKNLQSSFAIAETSLKSRAKKLELKEKLVCENERKFESFLSEIKLREEKLKLEQDEKKFESLSEIKVREEKLKLEEETVSEKVKKFESLLSEIRVREEKLKLEEEIVREKMNKFESLLSEIRVREEKLKLEEEIVREKVKKVELREKSVKECCELIEMKNKEIVDRRDELRLLEKGYCERLEVLEFNEKDVNEALEVKEGEIEELEKAVAMRKRMIEDQCRYLKVKEKELIDRCEVLELREDEIREEVKGFELKRRGVLEEFKVLEEMKREIEERCGELEVREKAVEDRSRALESRGKEVRELGEVLGMRAEEIVEGRRLLEERKKGMEGASQELEGRVKELDERGKEMGLREEKIRVHENGLELREKELLELQSKLESKEKELNKIETDLNKSYQDFCEELKLKKEQLIASHNELVLKEKEISDQHKDLELKQERMEEKMKALKVMEMDISSSFKVLESREKEINEGLKAQEGQMYQSPKKLMLVQKEVDGTTTIETNIVELKGDKIDGCHQSVVVKKEPIDLTVKQVEECSNMGELEKEQIMKHSGGAEDLKLSLIRKYSSLFEQAIEIFKQQDTKGKEVKDCCNMPRVKEEPISDTLTLRENDVVKSGNRVDSEKKQASEKPQADNLSVKSGDASSLFNEIQLVFRNNDARATSSYLIEHSQKDDMWREKILGLREEIPGLIKSLIDEHKYLQATMCTCVFKMGDVFPPEILLESHLEDVRQKVEEMGKEASAAVQDGAANMELSALRDVLQCVTDFKLDSIFPPSSLKLRISLLEKKMKENRTSETCFSDHDLKKKSEALKSIPTATITPNLSDHTQSDSHYEKKRKASSATPLIQNKHCRSTSREQNIPHNGHSPHEQDVCVMPYINHVAQPGPLPVTYRPAYHSPPPGVPHDIDTTGRYGVAGYYPGVVQTPTLHFWSQDQRTEPPVNFIADYPHTYRY